jgi:hypothetical protein
MINWKTTCERAIQNKLKETCERECVLNRGKDDIDLCGCRDADVAVFEGEQTLI